MSEDEMRFEKDGLTIVARKRSSAWHVSWLGASDSRNPSDFLRPVAARMIQAMRGSRITIDLSALEYMNSSTVSPIISMLKELDAHGIETRVLFSDADWQQTHLRCMRAITRVLKHVTVAGSETTSAKR
jgi:hypothetical protein